VLNSMAGADIELALDRPKTSQVALRRDLLALGVGELGECGYRP
jgi:hypothetical protein